MSSAKVKFDVKHFCFALVLISKFCLSQNGEDIVIAIAPDIPENKESLKIIKSKNKFHVNQCQAQKFPEIFHICHTFFWIKDKERSFIADTL